MSLLRVGPDGLLLIEAVIVSAFVAVFAWRRVGVAAGLSAAAVVAVALAVPVLQSLSLTATPGVRVRLLVVSFSAIPTAVLLGTARLRWISRHAWVLLVAGPFLFLGCFVGLCELCVKTGLI